MLLCRLKKVNEKWNVVSDTKEPKHLIGLASDFHYLSFTEFTSYVEKW
jgi:hypothetical protein